MATTIREVLGNFLKGDKLDQAVLAVEMVIKSNKSIGKRPEDREIDGVPARWCAFAKAWFAVDEFVANKTYTKRAYNVWHKYYNEARKMKQQAADKLASGQINEAEFREMMVQAAATDAKKDDIASYESVREHALAEA